MNNNFPSKEIVARLREQYLQGQRVELISMNDPHTSLRPGDRGTVSYVDDAGSIFVKWDNGSGLGIVYGEDSVRKIEREKHYETGAEFWRDTTSKYGLEEAAGICGRYLSMQVKTDSDEERQFCRELFIAMMEDTAGRADPGKLVYPFPFEKADERKEVSFYHENRDLNAYCAQAIDSEINASCFETYRYNLELAAMSVIQEYGFPRVNAVLAHNLQRHESDGRYSRDNKEWAAEFALPGGAFDYAYLKAHPILLEDFTNYTRKLYEAVGAERFTLPGAPEAGQSVQGYEISHSVWFDDKRGFAIGHNPNASAPYVCWQFTANDGRRDFYWGHYRSEEKAAEEDYVARTLIHMKDERAQEIPNPLAAAEMTTEQNYNMVDGALNNEKNRLDLTDGQTHEEVRELAPETMPQEKSSVIEQIREAKKAPPPPHKRKDAQKKEAPEREL
jgi:hypothetical protein